MLSESSRHGIDKDPGVCRELVFGGCRCQNDGSGYQEKDQAGPWAAAVELS